MYLTLLQQNKKSYTLDRKKFLIFVFSIVVIISVIIIVVSLNKKIEINDSTDISKLNAVIHLALESTFIVFEGEV